MYSIHEKMGEVGGYLEYMFQSKIETWAKKNKKSFEVRNIRFLGDLSKP